MVARDVVAFPQEIHTDPFQSGFDSQHRQEMLLGLKGEWFNSAVVDICTGANF
ncbi:hypothetical protein PZA11_006507 [Diplocarpon coronariae]